MQNNCIIKFYYLKCCLSVALFICFTCSCKDRKTVTDDVVASMIQTREAYIPKEFDINILNKLNDTLSHFSLSPSQEFDVLFFKYTYHYKHKSYIKASELADSLLFLITAHAGNPKLDERKTKAFVSKANVLMATDKSHEADVYYKEAVYHAHKKKNFIDESYINYERAKCLLNKQSYEESITYFKKAYELTYTIDAIHTDFKLDLLQHLGLAYNSLNNHDSAIKYYQTIIQVIDHALASNNGYNKAFDVKRAEALTQLANGYDALDKLDKAIKYYSEALTAFEALRIEKKTALIQLKLAIALVKKGKTEEVLQLTQSVNIANKEEQLFKQKFLTEYYMQTGNFEMATLSFKKIKKLEDALSKDRLKLINKNFDNEILAVLSKINEQQHEKREKTFVLTIISLVLFGVLVGIGLRNIYKQIKRVRLNSKRKIQLAYEKEKQLQQALKTKTLTYGALLSHVDDLLWSVDRNGKLISFNKAYDEFNRMVFGKSLAIGGEEARLENDDEYAAQWHVYYNRVLNGESLQWTGKGLRTNGYTPLVEFTLQPIRNEQNEIIGVSCCRKDVTEAFNRLTKIQAKNDKLKELAWMESHKARIPVVNLLGLISLIEMKGLTCTSELNQVMEMIKNEVIKLEEIMQEVTAFIYEDAFATDKKESIIKTEISGSDHQLN